MHETYRPVHCRPISGLRESGRSPGMLLDGTTYYSLVAACPAGKCGVNQ